MWWFGVYVPAAFQALLQRGEQSVPRTLLQEHIHTYLFVSLYIYIAFSLFLPPCQCVPSSATAWGTVRSTAPPPGTHSYILVRIYCILSLSPFLSMRSKLCYNVGNSPFHGPSSRNTFIHTCSYILHSLSFLPPCQCVPSFATALGTNLYIAVRLSLYTSHSLSFSIPVDTFQALQHAQWKWCLLGVCTGTLDYPVCTETLDYPQCRPTADPPPTTGSEQQECYFDEGFFGFK